MPETWVSIIRGFENHWGLTPREPEGLWEAKSLLLEDWHAVSVCVSFYNKSSSLNWRGRNASKLILQSQHCFHTKNRQTLYRKRNLQKNIPNEHRYKNLQQNISKLISKIHWKDHLTQSSRIYSRKARMVQHLQINHCDTILTKGRIKTIWSS